MLIKQDDSWRRSLGRGTLTNKTEFPPTPRPVGHSHFYSRALSRRRFIQASGTAAGMLLLSPGFSMPARAAVPGNSPKPIPGGFTTPDTGSEVFHNFVPGVFDPLDTDRSGIFDFNGDIGFAVIDGAGTGRNTMTGATKRLRFEVDLRFMQGIYVGVDGRRRHGTFCLMWLDLFEGQVDPATQIHDFNPGITENGVFWIVRIPDKSVNGDDDDDDDEEGDVRARLKVKNLETEDYFNLGNALADGPSVEAHVSFDVRWHDAIATHLFRNPAPDQRFTGRFTQTHAKVKWSAEEAGFKFHSDPASTSTTVYAEVGEERNGVFFS